MSKSKVIVANDLYLGYKNDIIIKGGNFSINSGDFVFLTGKSGTGKTTLIKHLYGELKPKKGYLNVGGFDMKKISSSKLTYLRRHIGVVFQDYKLINEWTIEKNILLPLMIAGVNEDIQHKKLSKLLSKVKLTHNIINKYPYQLSGGEQQRAAVIRAIINEPVLILADEPTGNLDDFSTKLVMNLFKFAHELGITVLIATHHLPTNFDIPYRNIHIEQEKIYEKS